MFMRAPKVWMKKEEQPDSVDPNFASTSFSPRMNSRANIIKPSKDGSFSPLQRAWQAVARRFTVGRDAVKPNFGSTETPRLSDSQTERLPDCYRSLCRGGCPASR